MSDQSADGHPALNEVLYRAEAWLERLEAITTRLEQIEEARSKEGDNAGGN